MTAAADLTMPASRSAWWWPRGSPPRWAPPRCTSRCSCASPARACWPAAWASPAASCSTVSFVEIFVKSQDAFSEAIEDQSHAYIAATACLFGGMLLLRFMAMLVHALDKNHKCHEDPAVGMQIRSPVMGPGTIRRLRPRRTRASSTPPPTARR
ncbi:unnamed protein product, partial [Prorocentrum cordatum]